jgi:hypothetical protein
MAEEGRWRTQLIVRLKALAAYGHRQVSTFAKETGR